MANRPYWLTELLGSEITSRINNDPRTIKTPNTFLGWPKNQIFWDVIGGGQADFDSPVGHLSGEDRALLYAKYNQPRHIDELEHAFTQLFPHGKANGTPTLIDLGCGPFTAGLALASTFGPNQPFEYHGIDRAAAMRSLGEHLAKETHKRGAFHPKTTWRFSDNLATHDFGKLRGTLSLVVASYLLASPTLDEIHLASSIVDALRRIGPGPAAILYTNSARPEPNKKFPPFRDALRAHGFTVEVDHIDRFKETKNPADLRYALLFRPAIHRLNIR
ncbi:hypothetical protein [Corallococcus sp. AB049A]|uniref:hypothetical protein n=1 Tax=Corallococcus sp. AB049A TaxID=2316721 RepID=UPI0011C48D15|nr:hypothetical protein [Corallococcus sp. AB049A]